MREICGGWYMENTTKGLIPPSKQKLSKKPHDKYDKMKHKLHTDNRNWNAWIYQLHWNKLEWVNPISKTKRKKPIQLIQRDTILIKMIERLIGLDTLY